MDNIGVDVVGRDDDRSLELTRARVLWEDDQPNGRGGVFLSDALERKYLAPARPRQGEPLDLASYTRRQQAVRELRRQPLFA